MRRICSLLLLGAGACSAQITRTYLDPKAAPIHRVCLVPVEARLTRVGMKGGEALYQQAEEWAGKFDAGLKNAIGEAGGEVSGDLSAEAQRANETTRQTVVDLRQKYANVSVQMRKKRGDISKGRYTLGDEISLLPCAREADSVVFADASGTVQTGSRKAVSILLTGVTGAFLTMTRYDIWISVVDTKTGAVKALLYVNSFGGKTGIDPELALKKALVSHLKKLPFGSPSRP